MALEEKTEHGTAAQSIEADEDFQSLDNVIGKNTLRLNLACGKTFAEGYTNVDVADFTLEAKDKSMSFVQCDLTKYPWPWADDEVYEIFCSHYVEHIVDLNRFMEECYRVLHMKGSLIIVAPYQFSTDAWQDPTHVRAINEITFSYYNQRVLKLSGLGHYLPQVNFEQIGLNFKFNPDWSSRAEEAKKWALRHYNNVASEIQVKLQKLPMTQEE